MDDSTPVVCPNTVTVRRNPHRRARPTPSAIPLPEPSSPDSDLSSIPSFPIHDILSIRLPEKPLRRPPGVDQTTGPLSENLRVYLRIRPAKAPDRAPKSRQKNAWPQNPSKKKADARRRRLSGGGSGESCVAVNDGERSVTLTPPVSLLESKRIKSEVFEGFSRVFASDSPQEDVYRNMVRPLVEEFLQGKSAMLAALGPSGSGKTHTVFGTPRDPGMVPLALQQIFEQKRDGQFYVSIFEIYSEQRKVERVCDLSPDGTELSMQQSTIKGLRQVAVSDVSHAESLINLAMLKRATAMTNMNSQSSRSQCIINIRYSASKDVVELDDRLNDAVLTIVDLAGAEREKRTGNQGSRFLESNFINNTVMVFGQCLRSLLEHQKNPKKPLQKHHQNSLLTRYLRDYLEGKKRMTLILTVKPEIENYLDTMYLLRQASPYMTIKFEKVEPMKLLQNKRHMQTLPTQGQLKKLKINAVNVCEVEGRDNPDENPLLLAESPRINKPYDFNMAPPKTDAKCFESRGERNHLIMQSFAKTLWNVLKECNKKLKNSENEILHLIENLENEKKRSMKLEDELRDFKSCCYCCRATSGGISDIQLQEELTLDDAELDEQEESNNTDRVKDISLPNIEDLKCSIFLELPACHEDNTPEKIASAKPSNHQSSKWSNTHESHVPHVQLDLDGLPQMDRNYHFADINTSEHNGSVTKEDQNDSSQEQLSESLLQQKVQFTQKCNIESQDFEAKADSCNDKPYQEAKAGSCNDKPSQDFEAKADSCNDKSPLDFEARAESCNDKLSQDSEANVDSCNDKPSQDSEAKAESCKDKPSQDFEARAESRKPSNDNTSQDFEIRAETRKPSDNNPPQGFVVRAESCKPSTDKQSQDFDARTESRKPYNDKPPQDFEARAETHKPSNDKPSQDFEARPETRKPSNGKPRRRLLPASSNLLRDFTTLGLDDELDKRKVSKGGKGIVPDERQRTQGSISLLRLLQRNLRI